MRFILCVEHRPSTTWIIPICLFLMQKLILGGSFLSAKITSEKDTESLNSEMYDYKRLGGR